MGRYLFLDRDGVLNVEKQNDYINNVSEWLWYEGALDALVMLSAVFDRVFIVTNQKGIAKGVTSREAVEQIHTMITKLVAQQGGRIDAIYYCPEGEAESPCRKPNIGMAIQAKTAFSEIDFTQSTMVGNNPSDMQFGRNAGMRTVLVTTTRSADTVPADLVDEVHASLWAYAQSVVPAS